MSNPAYEMFADIVKLVALLQASLEQMDELKNAPLYKHKLKNLCRNLETEIERTIRVPLRNLDSTDEGLMSRVQANVEMVMSMTADELAAMQVELDAFEARLKCLTKTMFMDLLEIVKVSGFFTL